MKFPKLGQIESTYVTWQTKFPKLGLIESPYVTWQTKFSKLGQIESPYVTWQTKFPKLGIIESKTSYPSPFNAQNISCIIKSIMRRSMDEMIKVKMNVQTMYRGE